LDKAIFDQFFHLSYFIPELIDFLMKKKFDDSVKVEKSGKSGCASIPLSR